MNHINFSYVFICFRFADENKKVLIRTKYKTCNPKVKYQLNTTLLSLAFTFMCLTDPLQ